MKRIFVSASVLLALHAACSWAADAPEWKIGLAVVDITPESPLPMAGYASRVKPFRSVVHPIHAKAMAFEDRAGNRAVLVTSDLLGLSRAVAEPVADEIRRRAGLQRSQILLAVSHTHSAPVLGLAERPDSGIAQEDWRGIIAYTRSLQEKLASVALEAVSRLEPAQLSWGSGVAHLVMNRREFTPRGVILGVNPRGPVDRSVPVLRADSAAGALRAALFGYACHNTTLTHTNEHLCGDYAGFAQAHLEAQHPGAMALFLTGCAGDANPYPRGTLEDARRHGAALGQEVGRVLAGARLPVRGPLTCAFDMAALPLQSFNRNQLEAMTNGPSWQVGNARGLLARLDRGESLPSIYDAPVAVWQFGADLTLVALSGEVVVDYVPLIEKAIGPLQLWIAAYCNEVFGYLPSARVLDEGGYECRGLYTRDGFFTRQAQDVLVEKVRELSLRAGRKALR